MNGCTKNAFQLMNGCFGFALIVKLSLNVSFVNMFQSIYFCVNESSCEPLYSFDVELS